MSLKYTVCDLYSGKEHQITFILQGYTFINDILSSSLEQNKKILHQISKFCTLDLLRFQVSSLQTFYKNKLHSKSSSSGWSSPPRRRSLSRWPRPPPPGTHRVGSGGVVVGHGEKQARSRNQRCSQSKKKARRPH